MDTYCWYDFRKVGIICYFSIICYQRFGEIKMIEMKKQSLSETFSIYFDFRMLKILLLGAISGFPWVLIGSSLSLWLKEDGLSRSTIGWAGLIFGVYAFNYLWAPLVDRIKIPFLTKKIGHRRGWIVLMQILILISLILWSLLNPTENLAFSNFSWFINCNCICNSRYNC